MAVKLPKLPFNVPGIQLGPRTRRILRYVGLAVLGVVVFVFAVQLSFPYTRVKDKVIEALQDKYDVTIGDVERGFWPGRVYFDAVTIRTRQTKPEETVTTFYIKRLQFDLGVMALIGGDLSLDLDATIGAGHLTGSIRLAKLGKGDMDVSFAGEDLPGANLPMRAVLGLPLTGKIEFNVDVHLPMEKSKMGRTGINWQKVRASFALSCPSSCTFGDGKTKLKPLLKNTRQQVMVADGIDFGKVTMDTMSAKATIKGGKLTLDKFETTSRDGELKVDYTMTLDKEFGDSMVTGCLRFKASDDLLKREPKTHAAITTTGAERRADGYFHIRLTDRFKDMKRLNQECGPGASNPPPDNSFSRDSRPNLTVVPDQPGSAVTAPTPPVEAPPPAPHDAGVAGSAASSGTAPPPTMTNEGGAPNNRLAPSPTGSSDQPPPSVGSSHGSNNPPAASGPVLE